MADKDFDNKAYWKQRVVSDINTHIDSLGMSYENWAKACKHVGVDPTEMKMKEIVLFSAFEDLIKTVEETFTPKPVKVIKEKKA